ncbi:DUF1707 and DUF2154 domain-containing protein [Spiractinospora alimapuensis]|uniref:DUF1707 SHOCT-like domain-containing protein n=1 Tax=Spiractinospora alimapuensis TaxID=2820884 RepID=UPI001F2813E3|nr:DUF1707 domain-containing protein [Spiractinospora alimapuensis]QVQ55078.1 DUF1707 and DUF2154 domain-containing protein [Spiractinospora alimapuensis]
MPPEYMRASDGDRERVADILRDALTDGRIDPTEHQERLDAVYAARTLGDLAPITTDLLSPERQPIQLRDGPILALFRNESRGGRWVLPDRHVTFTAFGTVELDLREALLTERHVHLDISAVVGRVVIHVPDNVQVRVRGWTFLGRRRTTARVAGPDAPTLEIQGFSVLGSVWVLAPKRKRSWRPWRRAT